MKYEYEYIDREMKRDEIAQNRDVQRAELKNSKN